MQGAVRESFEWIGGLQGMFRGMVWVDAQWQKVGVPLQCHRSPFFLLCHFARSQYRFYIYF